MANKFIGVNLKNLRFWYGLSQKALADKIGVNERRIWEYENGYRDPGMNEVNQLKSIFHVKSKYFYKNDMLAGKESVVDVNHISFRFYGD
ncbi:helix-turn-helix transcriptional regulator [Fictibacillus sp. NRS-1165]|uniref:helix-turn-helix transcriptional regulator n=1 Tax=Fictibacillus sp. NRS-1165 TaxID=3144463 RepID=UPI003D1ACA5C